MDEPKLLSKRQARRLRKQLLKRLKKSYKVAHIAWSAANYYDIYFDERVAIKLGMDFKQFEEFQKKVVNALSQYCKIRQERIFELLYSPDIGNTV